jgi:hypothetical protein
MAKHEKHEGEADRPGTDDAEDDLRTKPERRSPSNINSEAEERKRGGKAEMKREDKKEEEKKKRDHMKRKRGGKAVEMHGEHHHHAGRKPRKSGGRAGSEDQPFTSARHGVAATGRKLDKETMD